MSFGLLGMTARNVLVCMLCSSGLVVSFVYDSEECFSVHALFVWILAATVSSRLERMTESAWLKKVKRLLGLSVASNFTGVSLLRNLRPLKHEIHAKMGNNQHDALVERSRN